MGVGSWLAKYISRDLIGSFIRIELLVGLLGGFSAIGLFVVFTWLAAFGLLGLALGEEAMQSGLALLMWIAATQLLLSSLERDPLLIWFLSSTELLIGLAIAYLIVARGPQKRPTPVKGDTH